MQPEPDDVIELRRDFHRHPEVGFTEFRTAGRIAAAVVAAGWDVRIGTDAIAPAARLGVPTADELGAAYRRAAENGAPEPYLSRMTGGLTGLVADLAGHQPGPTLALRFDIDALPILETADAACAAVIGGYRSRNEGVMHACGHDGHAAIGVALARRLADRAFPGRVRLVFQPAEEGARGGAAMAAADVMAGVDRLVCVHLGLGVPRDVVATSVVGLLANTKLRVHFTGVAAHAAAAPQDGRHALLAAATALVTIHAMPRFAGVDTRVNVGMLSGGTTSNVIPADAVMLLETRADDEAANVEMQRRVATMLSGIAAAHEVGVAIERIGAASTGTCSPDAAAAVAAAIEARPGLTGIAQWRVGVSDDATALMRAVQDAGGSATYAVIGADLAAPHHTPAFDFDETALAQAVGMLEALVRRGMAG